MAAAIKHFAASCGCLSTLRSFGEGAQFMPTVIAFFGEFKQRRRAGLTKEHAEAIAMMSGAYWWPEESVNAGEGDLLRS